MKCRVTPKPTKISNFCPPSTSGGGSVQAQVGEVSQDQQQCEQRSVFRWSDMTQQAGRGGHREFLPHQQRCGVQAEGDDFCPAHPGQEWGFMLQASPSEDAEAGGL